MHQCWFRCVLVKGLDSYESMYFIFWRRAYIHLHVSPEGTEQRGSQEMYIWWLSCCFVCRLRLPLGLWAHSVVIRLPNLPSSLTPIKSKSASPLMALAPTKASLSTSKPEVLQPLHLWHKWETNIFYEVCWKLITNDHKCSFHMLIADQVCPAVVTPHSTANPQQPEYPQGQSVTVTCDLGYVADIVSAQITRSFNTFTFDVFKPLLS